MLPKPPKRGPKPKRRLNRVRKTSRAKLVREADALWAQIVKRAGVCDFSAQGLFPEVHPHTCANGLQAMHGISRRYYGTRWLLINGFAGCGAIHTYFGYREQEWDRFLVAAWGLPTWEELWFKAARLLYGKVDVQAALDALKAEYKTEGRA